MSTSGSTHRNCLWLVLTDFTDTEKLSYAPLLLYASSCIPQQKHWPLLVLEAHALTIFVVDLFPLFYHLLQKGEGCYCVSISKSSNFTRQVQRTKYSTGCVNLVKTRLLRLCLLRYNKFYKRTGLHSRADVRWCCLVLIKPARV